MRSLRISILNWTGDRQNWGCQATSQGLLEDLRDAVGPDQELCLHLVPLGHKTFGDRVAEMIFRRFIADYIAAQATSVVADWWFLWLNRLIHGSHVARVAQADVVLFMAEGTMNGQSFFRNHRLLMLPVLAAKRFAKPVLSLNQTLYTTDPEFRSIIRTAYSHFELVAVREPASLSFAREIGLPQALLFPDSAFRARSNGRPLRELVTGPVTAPLVCLTGSGDCSVKESAQHFQIVMEFARTNGVQVCGLLWRRKEIDTLRQIARAAGGQTLLFPAPGLAYEDVSALLAQSACLVGGRYHSAIQAAAVATPFVVLPSGSHKTQGLLKLLDYPLRERAFDDAAGIQTDLIDVLRRRDVYAAHLASRMDEVRRLRSRGIALVARLIAAASSGKMLSDVLASAPEAEILRGKA